MSEDFGKDLLMLGGTVAGFVAAMLSIMEKLLDMKNRLISKKDRKSPAQTERPTPDAPSTSSSYSSKPLRGASYLLLI